MLRLDVSNLIEEGYSHFSTASFGGNESCTCDTKKARLGRFAEDSREAVAGVSLRLEITMIFTASLEQE
jgi:hypothetical protein